jgi:hypothetical protein
MGQGRSSKTVVVGFRLPLDVYEVLQRRVAGKNSHWQSVAEYLQERTIYDVRRPHVRGKSSNVNLTDDDGFFQRQRGGRR